MARHRLSRLASLAAFSLALLLSDASRAANPTPAGAAAKPASANQSSALKSKAAKATARGATKNPHTATNRTTVVSGRKVAVTTGVPVVHTHLRGTITGTVTGPKGGAVPGASVSLHRPGARSLNHHVHAFYSTKTNSSGNFTVRLINARHYKLTAGKKNVGHADRVVRVVGGSVSHVNVALHNATAKKHKKHHRRA